VSEKIYFCSKCESNHRYTSKIGMEHLQYISQEQAIPERRAIKKIPASVKKTPSDKKNITGAIKRIPANIIDGIKGYRENYIRGVEKFGVWWKIFHISIWSFVLIFILTAVIILVVYLPQIEMIYWELR
jgi:hypothetical protein